MIRRTTTALAVGAVLLLVLAAPAAAHVEVGPETAVAGSETTLTFSFHHGKDGAATTGLEVRLPDGAEVVEVPPADGWTSSVADGVVSWSGGRVPDGTEAAFRLVVRLPAQAGTALFPTVQVTEAGELAWISPDEGAGEDQRPAPRVLLTAAAGEGPARPTGGDTATTRDLPRTAGEAEQRDDGSTDSAPWVIGSALAALAAVLVGGTFLKRRQG